MLRALGVGAAGVGLGGSGLLAACASSDEGAGSGGGGVSGSTTSTVPPSFDPSKPYWVQGNFRAVTTEETVTDLEVTGALPPELSGLFVRNGSNPPAGEADHWFLGDGMIHGVRLADGKASWYRNRYVATTVHDGGGEYAGAPQGADNQANVALVHHGGKLLALGEVGWPYELDPAELATVGPWDFDGRLGPTMTAHPKIDPATGRMHFFGYEFLRPALTYYSAAPDGTLDVVSPIAVDAATMVHDFAITDRHAVFWIGPVVFGVDERNPYPQVPFHWDAEGPSKVGVMPLDGSGDDIRWVDIDPCFVFHGLNAHTDGDDVVLRVNRLDEAFGPRGDLIESILTEWRIGTGGDQLTFASEPLTDRGMDLPTHDRRHTGRPTRHGWWATTTPPDDPHGFELAGICHLDLEAGTEDLWDPGPDLRAGEGFFVPGGDGEGEGWVLSFAWDRATDRSSLVVLDAQDVAAGPVAEVALPVRVPFGFHGLWLGEDDLSA